MLLAFVAEYAGFIRVKTLRLQESKDIVNRSDVSLQDVINGASPDYSVIAQKSASENILALTSNPFGLIYGLSLEDLMGRWDSRFEGFAIKAQQAEAIAQQAEAIAQQAETTAQQALALAENAAAKVECRNSFPIAIHNSILGRIVMRVRWLIEYMRGSR
jgi:O-antigen chain-terminating methyltransferase